MTQGSVIKRLGLVLAATALIGCEGVVDAIKENETAQLLGLVLDEPCDLTAREGRRLAGAYLRQPVDAPFGFDTLFVTGRESRAGLPASIIVDDTAVRRLRGADAAALAGSRRSTAAQLDGFAPVATLPNAYTLNYRSSRIDYTGPIVVGPSLSAIDIPTTGAQTFAGRIEITQTTQSSDGTPQTSRGIGQFEMVAGFGTKRAQFNASNLAGDLPFDAMSWTNLYQCGTRLVSSGQGLVTTTTADAAAKLPFQTEDGVVTTVSILESSLFAPDDGPAGPIAAGGVFVIQSDVGTIWAVFLSDVAEG